MNRPMHAIPLYFRYVRILARGAVQYQGWWVALIQILFICATDPLEIFVLFSRFGMVGGWSFWRVAMVYGWALSAFGMSELVARGFDIFPNEIKKGTFDRLLVRPRSTILQVITLQFQPRRFVRALFGFLLALLGIAMEGIPLPAWGYGMLALGYIAGTVVYLCIFMLQSALAFFTIGEVDIAYVFTNGSYQAAKTPPNLLPAWLRRMFTFVMPMFLFCYYPFAAAFGWGEPVWTGWLALPAAAIFFIASLAIWEYGVRHYKSAGS